MIEMRFEGGTELAANLAKLSERVSKRVQRQALREAAEPMRERMSDLAPHEPGKPDLREMMAVSNARGEDIKETAVAVGPTLKGFYGSFQEFGTSRHGAQPFARPAFDQTAAHSLRILSSELWDALKSRGLGLFSRGESSGPVTGGPGGSLL
jgi:HK97 gp10 family phage protein